MKFWQYLKDQLPLIAFWLGQLLIVLIVLWAILNPWFNQNIYFYVVLLSIVLLATYLIIDYNRKNKWWQEINKRMIAQEDSLAWPLDTGKTNEEKLIDQYTQQLISLHQQTEKALINQQQDQKNFVDAWVHEIKLPLAALQMILEADEDDLPEKDYLRIQNELQALYQYVEQVLYYARLDHFSKDYLVQEYPLAKMVKHVVQQNANQFIQKKIQFELTGDDEVVLTDEKWFIFILQQIIANALKYTGENGHITADMSKNEKGVWLSITDDGIGIPKEDLPRIFDKGFTGQNGRLDTQRHSTGLGLYLAKNLGEKLGHFIYASSIENEGTTIRILMPYLTYYNDGEQPLI